MTKCSYFKVHKLLSARLNGEELEDEREFNYLGSVVWSSGQDRVVDKA